MSEQNSTSQAKSETEIADKAKLKAQREDQKRREHIEANYPHADASTLTWYPEHNKYGCMCKSVVSGKVFGPVMTSDLFQVDRTEEERKAAKAAKKAKQKELHKKALALIASGEVK